MLPAKEQPVLGRAQTGCSRAREVSLYLNCSAFRASAQKKPALVELDDQTDAARGHNAGWVRANH